MKSFVIVNSDSEIVASGSAQDVDRFLSSKPKSELDRLQIWDVSQRPEAKISIQEFKKIQS